MDIFKRKNIKKIKFAGFFLIKYDKILIINEIKDKYNEKYFSIISFIFR